MLGVLVFQFGFWVVIFAGCLSDMGFLQLCNCLDYKLCVPDLLINLWSTMIESFVMLGIQLSVFPRFSSIAVIQKKESLVGKTMNKAKKGWGWGTQAVVGDKRKKYEL